jgi:pSer/pThr/pTyr-binding forkhead associated (FHA) protein
MSWLKNLFDRTPRLIYEDPVSGQEVTYTIKKDRVEIGRAPTNDIILLDGDQKISRRHAALVKSDNTWTLEDLNSTYGVSVNDEKVEGTRILSNGSIIQIMKVALTFLAPGYEITEAHLSQTIVEPMPELPRKQRKTRIKTESPPVQRVTRLKPRSDADDDEDLRDTVIGSE